MCYEAMIAESARRYSNKWNLPYETAMKIVLKISEERWVNAVEAIRNSPVPLIFRDSVEVGTWTFLSPWINDEAEISTMAFRTGCCRTEDMFTKTTWKRAARAGRVALAFRYYYEYQHRGSKRVRYQFYNPDGQEFYVGGVAQKWQDRWTFAVCTMRPNNLSRWIHNNPKAHDGPRQPVIFRSEDEVNRWVEGGDAKTIEDILQVRDDGFLVAEITAGKTGKMLDKLPPEPPGRPEGVVGIRETTQEELF